VVRTTRKWIELGTPLCPAESLINDLEEQVFGPLPDETRVYPGHRDDTTPGTERPSLRAGHAVRVEVIEVGVWLVRGGSDQRG
jgi:hypothetical protein